MFFAIEVYLVDLIPNEIETLQNLQVLVLGVTRDKTCNYHFSSFVNKIAEL